MVQHRARYVEAFRAHGSSTEDDWLRRLADLTSLTAKIGRMPSLVAPDDINERILARWLSHQRRLFQAHQLPPIRVKRLDAQIPGWRPLDKQVTKPGT